MAMNATMKPVQGITKKHFAYFAVDIIEKKLLFKNKKRNINVVDIYNILQSFSVLQLLQHFKQWCRRIRHQ